MVIGASGMLGQTLMAEGQARGHEMIGERVEVTDDTALDTHLAKHQPDIVINAAALIDLKACEADPARAYLVNTRPVSVLANYRLVQISSDQAANPFNVYAKSKRAAEELAGSDSLIIRTNIVGLKNMAWAFDAIENDSPITLFDDYFTSSIDVWSFSAILFDLLEKHPTQTGILNIASQDTVSKKTFVEALANRMGKRLTQVQVGSVKDITPERPLMNRLREWEIEALLNRPMPNLNDVISALVERRNQPCMNLSPLKSEKSQKIAQLSS